MTLNELKLSVIRELKNRNLKNPQIRKNALEKVCKYISEYEQIYLHNQNVILPKDKNEFKNEYERYKNEHERYKGIKINGAESSIINEIYNQLNKAAI